MLRTQLAIVATLVVASFGSHTAFATPANLIDNGGFERGLGDWNNFGTPASVTQTGQRTGKAAVTVGPSGGIILNVDGLTPGSAYTFSGYLKVAGPGEQCRLTVQGFGVKTVSAGAYATEYTLRSITFTPSTASGQLVFWKDGGTVAALGDDFSLVAGSTPLEFKSSVIVAAASTDPTASLIGDGGFEGGDLGAWQSYGTPVTIAQDAVHGGKYAVKIAPTGGAIYEVKGLKPSTTYTFSGWAKVTTDGEAMRLTASGYGDTDKSVGIRATDFTQGSVTFTTGSTNTTAKLIFWKDGGSGAAYIDDLSLTAK